MANDTYYQQTYKCQAKGCGVVRKEYIWSSEIDTKKVLCGCGSKKPMTLFFEEQVQGPLLIGANSGKTYDVKADRRERARTHFKKEVLPYLPKDDKNAHLSKMKRSGENPHK